ncbi:MAG: hypothetical protein ACI8PT_002066 [Gammaproteobacteria bacterium]|jgi:hypothetical protein
MEMQTQPMRNRSVDARVPHAAAWLGAAGLIPFIAGAVTLWTLPSAHAALAADLLKGYGAIILAFMGAVHWGLAMTRDADSGLDRWFLFSVAPALIGWGALMLSALPALVVLGFAFAMVFGLDRAAIAANLAPAWYPRLRTPLTIAVIGSLAIATAALWYRVP